MEMGPATDLGPFRPGFGGQPPYLAGREAEQRLLRRYLSAITGAMAPGTAVVLYGPRGNGKTVLLGWLAAEAGERVDVVQITPSKVRDRRGFAGELLPDSWWTRHAPSQVPVAGTGVSWRPGKDRPPSVETVLTTRVRKRPLLLLLDEAHTLDPVLGGELLNAAQQVGSRLPFLLVLAGTPNLPSHLASMSPSFWNRARQVRVGRLSEKAAAEGVRRPLADEDITGPSELLAAVASESEGYPFFVQLLGDAVWQQTSRPADGRRGVTSAVWDAARLEFTEAKHEYCRQPYRELEAQELLPVAASVAQAFEGNPLLGDPELNDAIGNGLGTTDSARILAARESLSDLGYVWEPGAAPLWEPGIPSLMDYVRTFAPQPLP